MIIQDSPTAWRAQADNLYDLQQWIETTPKRWSSNYSHSYRGNHDWDYAVGYEGAVRLARDGWSEGAKDLSDRLSVRQQPLTGAPKWRYDVAGERPDIGRYLSGDPANMMRHGHPKGNKPIITLAFSGGISSGTKADQVANYGAAIVAIIDRLEASGRRVEVLSSWVTTTNKKVVVSWTVKRAEDAVDLATLAFSIAHPACPRRLGFAAGERSTAREDASYGRPGSLQEGDLIDASPFALLIPGLVNNGRSCDTLDSAIKFAAQQINTAAGETLVELE